jgi:hypothetical protein
VNGCCLLGLEADRFDPIGNATEEIENATEK